MLLFVDVVSETVHGGKRVVNTANPVGVKVLKRGASGDDEGAGAGTDHKTGAFTGETRAGKGGGYGGTSAWESVLTVSSQLTFGGDSFLERKEEWTFPHRWRWRWR